MSLDIKWLASEIDACQRVARILVAQTAGSVPREVGTSMIVTSGGQSGTIGGGSLEFAAVENAREMLELDPSPRPKIDRHPLGPNLGQCCGGSVTLITEIFDKDSLERIRESEDVPGFYARPIYERREKFPREIKHFVKKFQRSGRKRPVSALISGWMLETVADPAIQLWIFGAGHVGRAIVSVLAPIPDLEIYWIDTGHDRYPDDIPETVTKLIAKNPSELAPHAPLDSEHLVLTYSHAMDLEICSGLLARGVAKIGLIGSETKWARFRKRLIARGHDKRDINLIQCPIGNPELGKHPQAIAVGVASEILNRIMPDPMPKTEIS